MEFEGEGAVVSARFDRIVRGRFDVLRLHQEDFCQALGVFPDRKYANEGGPGARDVLHVLATQPNSEANRALFAGQLFFNYLIGAPDAHAKNYSILLTEEEGVRLSPLYDVASALPYESPAGSWKMAMSIGGENRFGQVKKSHLVRFAEAAGLEASTAVSLMANLAMRIPGALSEVMEECEAPGVQELGARLVPAVADLCARTLSLLE